MTQRRWLLVLFFVSGACSLVYQVLWTRLLTLVLGSTTFAVSAVLTAFMTGLALGAYVFGKIADRTPRPLRLYAGLEGGIAACALVLPYALSAISVVYPRLYDLALQHPWTLPLARLVASFFLLLAPCMLMGGTLPVLVRFAARSPNTFGREFSWLYGINTFGAVAGSLLAGFFLLGNLGLSATNYLALGGNLLLAGVFLRLDQQAGAVPPSAPASAEAPPAALTRGERVVVAVAVLSGLTALALEVLWTRALLHALFSTTYSFTVVLATLLLALALGSFLAGRWPVPAGPELERRLIARLVVFELLFSAALLAELPLLGRIVALKNSWAAGLGPDYSLTAKFLIAAVLVFVPATLAGTLFPLSVQVLASRLDRVGVWLGRFYLWNTLAAAAGALLAGYVLVPGLGVRPSYLGIAAVHAVLAVGLGLFVSRRRLAGLALLVFLFVSFLAGLSPGRLGLFGNPVLQFPESEMELLDYREATDATFAVYRHRPSGSRFLYINGFSAASVSRAGQYMPMMSHLPLLFHPDPKRVLVIAFGTGSTAGTATLYPVDRIDVVDISPEVYELARYFEDANHGVLHDPRTRAWVEDGRNFVESVDEKFDVVTSEPMPPKFAHMVNFYTRDYYQAVRARLRPGGLVCQWLPFHLMRDEDARMIVRAFIEVFPNSSLWFIRGTGVLLGSIDAPPVPAARLAERMAEPRLRADLERLGFPGPDDLLKTFALDSGTMRIFSRGALLLTDDTPYLEFSGDQPEWHPSGVPPILQELSRLRPQSTPPITFATQP